MLRKIIPWAILAAILIALVYGMRGCGDTAHDVKTGLDGITDAAGNVVEGTTDLVGDTAEATVDAAGDVVDGTVDLAGDAANAVGDAAEATVDAAGDVVDGTVDLVGDAANAVGDAAEATVEAAGDVVDGTVDLVGDAANAVGDAAEATVEAAGDAVEATGSLIGDAFDFVKNKANAFGDALGDFFSFELPNGTSISIPNNGPEQALIDGIADGEYGEAYILDRIQFASGSDALTSFSEEQVVNIAEILKAYPEANILLQGHTDSSGSEAFNLALSKKRAASVKNLLVELGINSERVATAGLASAQPVASNETALGKQRNRRIDIQLTK